MNYKKRAFKGIFLSLIVVLSLFIVSLSCVFAEVQYVKVYDKNGETIKSERTTIKLKKIPLKALFL